MKYYYQNFEIEILAKKQDHALAGLVQFRPAANHVFTLLVCGGYTTAEEVEEKVLAQAKALIDNAMKSNFMLDHRAGPASWCQRLLDMLQRVWIPGCSAIQLVIGA